MTKHRFNDFKLITGNLHSNNLNSLQVNLGRLCNLCCNHCHLAASPYSTEVMPWTVMEEIIRVVNKENISTVDITGGAPELNPNLKKFLDGLIPSGVKIQLRTNLVAMLEPQQEGLPEYFSEKMITLVASLPCYLESNVRAQRGNEVFKKSIDVLKLLNTLGYGTVKNLELDLVYNPGGPFLPGLQEELEVIYRRELQLRYGIVFNKLFVLTNMPVGRFKVMLCQNGIFNEYLALLKNAYNRETLNQLMCRSQISVGWDGTLYDCDFNLALGQPIDIEASNITFFNLQNLINRKIVTGEHCFGCTAGSGSSCNGSLKASG